MIMKAMHVGHPKLKPEGKSYANFIMDFGSASQSGTDIMVVRSNRFLISRFRIKLYFR